MAPAAPDRPRDVVLDVADGGWVRCPCCQAVGRLVSAATQHGELPKGRRNPRRGVWVVQARVTVSFGRFRDPLEAPQRRHRTTFLALRSFQMRSVPELPAALDLAAAEASRAAEAPTAEGGAP